MRNYTKLSIEEFGRHLLESGDLDPIYIALCRMKLDPVTLNRWLLAYWCCYDAGVACWLAAAETPASYWERMQCVARNEDTEPPPIGGRWKRGHERRHWRGLNALKSLACLRERYPYRPEDMASYCAHGELPGQQVLATQTTCYEVVKRAREHVGFGPWIGFKVADMAERVMGVSVSFDAAEVFLFDSPREAALTLFDQMTPKQVRENDVFESLDGLFSERRKIEIVINYLSNTFKVHNAPPHDDRPLNVQEIETILCKYKSHLSGHYPLFNDIREIREGLAPWIDHSLLAHQFLRAMPKVAA